MNWMTKIKERTFNMVANQMANVLSINVRMKLFRKLGFQLEDSVTIRKYCYFESNRVRIGEHSFVNANCSFYTGAGDCYVDIGRHCQIGGGTAFVCTGHEIGTAFARAGQPDYASIKIGDGCWIGANVTILRGVTVERGVVIGAGAVVTKDCQANGLYVGMPARRVKEL